MGSRARPRRLRVAIDATPLLGNRTGIGTYVEHLMAELARRDDLSVRAVAFSVRARGGLAALPPGVRVVHRPVPARLLHRAWARGDLPAAQWLTGRVDVFHATNFVLPPVRRTRGVVTIHDLSFLRFPEMVDSASLSYRTLVPKAVWAAAAVITVSHAMAEEIAAELGVPEERIVVTELGVDESWFEPAPPPVGIPADYLLAVGTIEPRKGLDVLLDAYRHLLGARPAPPPLVLVGSSGWGPELDRSGIPRSQLVLPGYASPRLLRSLVAHARLLAYPSRYEGFGLPPLEAMAAGTPVVASDLPSIREVVAGHARLVPPGDPVALAAAIEEVLGGRAGGPAATAAARRRAATFTWARCAQKTVDVYRSVAAVRA